MTIRATVDGKPALVTYLRKTISKRLVECPMKNATIMKVVFWKEKRTRYQVPMEVEKKS